MKRYLEWWPTWQTFLIYIGGIPSLVTATIITFMVFYSAKNKAFSYKKLKELRHDNNLLIQKEKNLHDNVLNAPKGVQFIYRILIGDLNYFRLMNRRR